MPELTALDRPAPSDPVLAPLLFDVYVSDEHAAVVDGERVEAGAGQSVHEAILDLLQRHARDHRGPVRATVFDRPAASTLRIEVAPDGSSRIPDPEPDPGSRENEDLSPVPTVGEEPVPAPLAEHVDRIREAVHGGDTEHAGALAAALRECLAGDHGPAHPQALEARAMEAYVAHLAGDHPLATSLAVGVARIRCGLGDARAADDVLRATAAWQRLVDERSVAAHGRELLHLWGHLAENGRLGTPHTEAMRLVRQYFAGPEAEECADGQGVTDMS